MSSDDGYILRKRGAKFVLHHYFASDHAYPDFNYGGAEFDTLEAALRNYEELESNGYPSEYGLIVKLF